MIHSLFRTSIKLARSATLVALPMILGLTPLGVSADEAIQVSADGMRSTGVQAVIDSKGTIWLLWVVKGERIEGAGHASRDDLHLLRWPESAPPDTASTRLNPEPGTVRGSALSRPRIAIDGSDQLHVLYPATGISPVTGKPVINVSYLKGSDDGFDAPRTLNRPAVNDLSETSHSGIAASATFISLAASPGGAIFALWLDSRHSAETESPAHVFAARSTDGGLNWTQDQSLFQEVCPCCQPDSRWSGDHLLVSSRMVDAESHRDPHIRRFDAQLDALGEPVRLGDQSWRLEGCPLKSIAVAGADAWDYAAWYSETDKPSGVWFARSAPGDAAFKEARPLQPNALISDAPALASDLAQVWVAWHAKESESERRVFVSHSDDHGATFSGAEAVSKPGGTASYPTVAIRDGTVVVAWEQNGAIHAWRQALGDAPDHDG